jgi:hypothetical protein
LHGRQNGNWGIWIRLTYKHISTLVQRPWLLILLIISEFYMKYNWGRAVAWWLRYYATNRQVAGPIPDGFIGIFQ